MSAGARVTVTFLMEYEAGAGTGGGGWGDDCTIGQLRKQANDGAKDAAERVVRAAAEQAKVRLTVQKIGSTSVVLLPDRE